MITPNAWQTRTPTAEAYLDEGLRQHMLRVYIAQMAIDAHDFISALAHPGRGAEAHVQFIHKIGVVTTSRWPGRHSF